MYCHCGNPVHANGLCYTHYCEKGPDRTGWQIVLIVIIFFLAATQLADIDEYFRPWRYRY